MYPLLLILALLVSLGQGKRVTEAGLELGIWKCGSGSTEGDCEQITWPSGPSKEILGLNTSSEQPIIIFTHGLLENVYDDEVSGRNSSWKFVQSAYQREGFDHFIFIKFEAVHIRPRRRKILQSSSIITLAPVIRDKLTDMIMNLVVLDGVDASRIHLIGQNVGAHIMGGVGHQFYTKTKDKIGRITGLDPSSPLFLSPFAERKFSDSSALILDPSDAQFVDVVHTDSNGLGSLSSFGHVDWFVNGGAGSMQNGCTLPLMEVPFLSELVTIGCAHARASALWAYAIGKEVNLRGCSCKRVTGRSTGKSLCKSIGVEPCSGSSRSVRFGQYTPRSVQGDFYLHVSDSMAERLPPVWYQAQMAEAEAGTQ